MQQKFGNLKLFLATIIFLVFAFITQATYSEHENDASDNGKQYFNSGYLKAIDSSQTGHFGEAVAIDGDTLVVGAWNDNSIGPDLNTNGLSQIQSGAAYVFTKTRNGWSEPVQLKASNATSYHAFGKSVAIDGDTIVVGAWTEGVDQAGAAYVFTRNGGVWTEQAYLKASNSGPEDQFGSSVAVQGNTIVVGARQESGDGSDPGDNSAEYAGAAYLFVRNGEAWTEQAYIKASSPEAYSNFGDSVALDGDTIVIGASQSGFEFNRLVERQQSSYGSVHIFTGNGSTWTQQAQLKEAKNEPDNRFGRSVAIAGDTVVVGAPWDSDNRSDDEGSAYVFVRSGSVWSEQARLEASNSHDFANFGGSVAIDGEKNVAVGAYRENSEGVTEAGSAYLFVWNDNQWEEAAKFSPEHADRFDYFGIAVDVDEGRVVVGASWEDGDGSIPSNNSALDSGAAFVYEELIFSLTFPLIINGSADR